MVFISHFRDVICSLEGIMKIGDTSYIIVDPFSADPKVARATVTYTGKTVRLSVDETFESMAAARSDMLARAPRPVADESDPDVSPSAADLLQLFNPSSPDAALPDPARKPRETVRTFTGVMNELCTRHVCDATWTLERFKSLKKRGMGNGPDFRPSQDVKSFRELPVSETEALGFATSTYEVRIKKTAVILYFFLTEWKDEAGWHAGIDVVSKGMLSVKNGKRLGLSNPGSPHRGRNPNIDLLDPGVHHADD